MSARLDTMLEAGEAYLNVLRAKNNEGVNRDNLKLTRKNLSLAETRNAIGVAGREEDAKWEAEQVLALNPDFSLQRIRQAFPFKDPADIERFLDGLRIAGIK